MSFSDFVYSIPEAVEAGLTNAGQIAGDVLIRGYNQLNYKIDDNALGQSEYDFKYRTFPADLANDYVGHYMIININVPVYPYSGTARTSYGGPAFNQTLFPNNSRETEYSKVDTLRFGNALDVGGFSPVTGNQTLRKEPLSIPRYTRRIKESIALFMPTPVVFNTMNEFQEISLSGLGAGLVTQTAGLVGSIFGGELGGRTMSSIAEGGTKVVGQISGMAGYPINPRIEVIFSKTNLRQFMFEFLMAPRNPQESENMKEIIKTLRYHSAPELDPVTAGFTYIPPAEFDVTFYDKGKENTNIPRINTCVLDRIEVDYAPAGTYSTFSNGHPVTARLSLGMREIEVNHKRRILQGF